MQASIHLHRCSSFCLQKNSVVTQHMQTVTWKKRVAFLILFPLQKFPAGLGSSRPSINPTTSVRSVPLHCSWNAARLQPDFNLSSRQWSSYNRGSLRCHWVLRKAPVNAWDPGFLTRGCSRDGIALFQPHKNHLNTLRQVCCTEKFWD